MILKERFFMCFVPPSPEYYAPAGICPSADDSRCAALGALAALSVFEEALLSPKPGLVCPDSQGSHTDMNWITFILGASAIAPFWQIQAANGLPMAHYKPSDGVAERLRKTGQDMERAMFAATGGVNTHKGLIFALSLLLGAWGSLADRGAPSRRDIFRAAGEMAAPMVERDMREITFRGRRGGRMTHGERIFFERGIGGIRSEAARGFPSVAAALGAFEESLEGGASIRDAALRALIILMTICEDTNVIHRGGVDFWRGEYKDWARETEGKFNPLEPGNYEPVLALGRLLVERGVSPGGAADMLACTLFMYRSKIADNMVG
jgi:triphosphoribosyl-dephospho-CoA synthetase